MLIDAILIAAGPVFALAAGQGIMRLLVWAANKDIDAALKEET
jgi:hypothetical protein